MPYNQLDLQYKKPLTKYHPRCIFSGLLASFLLCPVRREHQLGGLHALPEAAFLQGQHPIQQPDAERHQGVFLDHQLPLLHQAHAKR